MLDFQKLDPFWNLWSKPNPGISSKMLYPAQLNRNLERKIGHEIFVKTEKTEYLSNQLTSAHFDWKFILPIKFGTSEQIFIFWISKVSQISGSPTVKVLFGCLFWAKVLKRLPSNFLVGSIWTAPKNCNVPGIENFWHKVQHDKGHMDTCSL